ncbi:hypothetical protein [Streptomyces sp. UNOB3_S3]|uniref:hypothetical protein n=1 Tax=Streptomyces sp. UNOB3_S3 TaxID=2871682 RepID=UPI001E377A80|nr:hypothetical protein [Streptomyces sp. UNOB3_S3]MCC3775235.1 hypothetical protein [Streptomyces sp. UNOB3_S3]
MNVRRSIAVSAATLMLGGGLALAAPAANAAPAAQGTTAQGATAQEHWRNLWNADISGDYLGTHGKKWVSGLTLVPSGANMARGVFTCWGGGEASLTVKVVGGGSNTKTHRCNGVKHYATAAAKPGQAFNLTLKGSKNTHVEAWVNG